MAENRVAEAESCRSWGRPEGLPSADLSGPYRRHADVAGARHWSGAAVLILALVFADPVDAAETGGRDHRAAPSRRQIRPIR